MIFRTFLRQAEQISGSATYDDALVVATAESYLNKNIEADLNYIRSQLKTITGETNWYDTPGVSLADVEYDEQGMSGSFLNIYAFTGMTDRNDADPTYSSQIYVTNGDSLETAIGLLDAAIASSNIVYKEVERTLVNITSGSAHTIPGAHGHLVTEGNLMDLYLNGQLLQKNTGTEFRDYIESGTDEVKFTFRIHKNSYLTYIIRQ
jgi:hypothetical protein